MLQELNSVEAIKGAVQHGLGVAFVSVTAIQKELELGLASRVSINGVRLFRTLCLVRNPRRDYSHMARKFMVEVFGMVNMEPTNSNTIKHKQPSIPCHHDRHNSCVRSVNGVTPQRHENGDAALPHVTPAARPWENAPTRHGITHGKPILQQAQFSPSGKANEHSGLP